MAWLGMLAAKSEHLSSTPELSEVGENRLLDVV